MNTYFFDIKRSIWLFKYYIFNFYFTKYRSKYIRRNLHNFEEIWNELYKKFHSDEILVIGNGPSLNSNDLYNLSSMISIASNKIYLIFDQTSWRPDLYTINDYLLAYKHRKYSFKEFNIILCSHKTYSMLNSAHNKIAWRAYSIQNAKNKFYNFGCLDINPQDGFFNGYTITIQNIQIAMWLGAKRIYLIGCDHHYKESTRKSVGVKLRHEKQNHFHPEYRKKGEIVNNASIEKMNESYAFIGTIAKNKNIQVINISRNTALKEFPTIDTDTFIKSYLNQRSISL